MSAAENLPPEYDDKIPLADAERLLKELASLSLPASAATDLLFGLRVEPNLGNRVARPNVEARYQTLVEQMPAVIFMAFLGDSACEAYVSPQIEAALGFTQEEWLNDPVRWYRQIHPDDRDRWSMEAAELVCSGRPVRSVYRVLSRSGSVIWFQCDVKMVFTDDGRPWFVHGTAFDISELKETEEALKKAHRELEFRVQERTAELRRANTGLEMEIAKRERAQAELARQTEELARLNADLEQFAYSASHDLQQPLRNLALYSQLLQRRYSRKLDKDADEFLELLSQNARQMSTMLDDLRAYTETFSDQNIAVEPADANTVFRKAVDDLQLTIRDTQAEISADMLPRVQMREVHLHQIFQNLLSNALKYRSDKRPRVRVSATASGAHWQFSIKDNGIGIDPEYQDRIFELFRRLHTQETYQGSGIGLALCKRVVERYGGRIWVESELNRGSTFFFTVPSVQSLL